MSNKYLEKVAEELSREDEKTLQRGYDRYGIQSTLHGVLPAFAGGGIGMAMGGKNIDPNIEHTIHIPGKGTFVASGGDAIMLKKMQTAKGLSTAGALVGGAYGVGRAYQQNKKMHDIEARAPEAYDKALIAGGKKSYLAGFFGSHPLVGLPETYVHNTRVEEAQNRLTSK